MRRVPLHLGIYLALLLAGLSSGTSLAQGGVPEPAPTDDAANFKRRVDVTGEGLILPGLDPAVAVERARQAAYLNAYRQLSEEGMEILGQLSEDPASRSGYQYYRISDDHPNDTLMAWCLRAEVVEEQTSPSTLKLHLKSPPVSEVMNDYPQLVRSVNQDLDGDGIPEIVGAAYDGRVYALKKVGRGFQVMASTPSQATLSVRTYAPPGGKVSSWDHVRLSRLESIQSVEVLRGTPTRLRVLVTLSSAEEVGGVYLGRASEEREVLLRLNAEPEPTLELQAPVDFSRTNAASEPLKCILRAPAGLAKAKLRFNGRDFWQTPDGLSSRKLNMDVMVPLLPGYNRALVQLMDQNKITTSREVVLHRNAPVPMIDPRNRRALMIGIGKYESPNYPALPCAEGDLTALRTALGAGGFTAENVRTLTGASATRAKILEAVHSFSEKESGEGSNRGLLVIYFNGLTTPGTAANGKSLLPYDARGLDQNAIGPQELVEALGPLGNQEVLFILDSARNGLGAAASHDEGRWLDCHDFLESISRSGWAVLTSSDPDPGEREALPAARLSQALVQVLYREADTDNDGYVELDELYRVVFTKIREELSKAKARPSYPLRRGQILGRLPIVKIR